MNENLFIVKIIILDSTT